MTSYAVPETLDIDDTLIDAAGLGEIRAKVDAGERLSFEDGVALYENPDINAVGALANRVRLRMHGKRTFFNINLHIDYTNICIYSCKFCAFAAKPGDERGYLMLAEDVEKRIREITDPNLSEVHMVAGIHPDMGYEYYLDIIRAAKRAKPDIHVKAYTMVEIDHILRISGKSEKEVFDDLREAGLGSCPGGGAEVLSTRIHKAVFRDKISPEEWLATAAKVQRNGFRMNATMLYGHVERIRERVEHFVRLRQQQDESGKFMTFIPLAFWPYNTALEHYGKVTTGWDDLRNIAISRLMLDNIPNIKAYWVMLTPRIAQTALSYGANDLDGTVTEEKITHDAGTSAPMLMPRDELVHLIKSAGYEPVLRDTVYERMEHVG
ncbi:MAG: aminofutalosine synthase MqnE [Planctomycetota bacterium]|nr:MAG: aminofutalosine synthase MqnE [Planctomycetota bacterium]